MNQFNNMKDRLLRPFIFAFSFLVGFCVNEINLSIAKENTSIVNTQSSENGVTIWSVDNEYYISPVENFLNGNGWKRSPGTSNGDYFRRVPGYSLLYLLFLKISPLHGFRYLVLFQLLLLSFSIVLFYESLKILKISTKLNLLCTGLYLALPNFYNYSYFTITESVTPSYIVISFYLLLRYYEANKNIFLVLSSIILSIAVYTRPLALLIFIIYVPCVIYSQSKPFFLKATIVRLVSIGLPLVTFATLWCLRNYQVSGEFVLLEKRNHPQTKDHYKPSFEALCMLYYSWGGDSNDMNALYFPFMYGSICKEDVSEPTQKLLNTIPDNLKGEILIDLNQTLALHSLLLQRQSSCYVGLTPFPSKYDPLELDICKRYENLERKVRNAQPFLYYVVAPLKRLYSIVGHSNTSGFFIFANERLNPLTYSIKAINKLFHVSCYLISFLGLFFCMTMYFIKKRINSLILAIGAIEFIALVFFMYVFKATEQRYMLLFLPLIIIFDVYCIQYICLEIKQIHCRNKKYKPEIDKY